HKLSGKVEELEYLIKRRTQSPYGQVEGQGVGPGGLGGSGGVQGYNSSNMEATGGGVKAVPPSIVPLAPLEEDETFAKTLPANASRVFSQALSKIREGNFQESLSSLQQLIQQGEKTEWSANVLFWLGVTYDGLGEDKNALRAYNDLIVQFPRHKRVPLALYRQSQNLQRLGDKKSANLLLRKIVGEYPDTSEGARAKEDLKKF
ncbi:MAG: tetratricopeptide repeat protein, partial [SAR324 cluster bacterium]|nr:tetratricopeptide repeat protein [SAR324 cluster bacterium]